MKIITKENEGLKVLVLSDLHIFKEEDIKNVEKLMIKLKNNEYSAIYLVGDILDATNILNWHERITGRLLELISFFGDLAPTYIVYGSHDLAYHTISKKNPWLKDEQTFKEKFLDKIASYEGIYVLENETRCLKKGTGYTISGFNPSLEYAMNTPDGDNDILLKEYERYEFLTKLKSDKTNTVLCHYPNAIIELHKKGILKNADLNIAGHNHNGCTQFRFLPVEFILNFFGQNNRGLITPGKKISFDDTKNLCGVLSLGGQLLINPSFKTFAACTGSLEKLDGLFYSGYTEIEYVPEEKLTR